MLEAAIVSLALRCAAPFAHEKAEKCLQTSGLVVTVWFHIGCRVVQNIKNLENHTFAFKNSDKGSYTLDLVALYKCTCVRKTSVVHTYDYHYSK